MNRCHRFGRTIKAGRVWTNCYHATFLNALILIPCPGGVYLTSGTPSLTARIPVAFGLAILICYLGVKAEGKVIAHIAVTLTLMFLAFFAPLRGVVSRGDRIALLRVALTAVSCVWAIVFFIKSFREARRAREICSE